MPSGNVVARLALARASTSTIETDLISSVRKMAQCVALAETRLSRAEVLLVASLGDIALKCQAGIG